MGYIAFAKSLAWFGLPWHTGAVLHEDVGARYEIFRSRADRSCLEIAIDPGIGSVIETVTFGEGPDVETWRRYRVVESAPATRP